MPATAYGIVVSALAARLRAASGYRAPGTPGAGVPVFVGSQVRADGDRSSSWVCVAWPGIEAGESAGRAGQSVGAMKVPGRPREERGLIQCRARYGSRDAGLTVGETVLAAALAHLDTVADVLRGTADGPTLGLVPGSLPSLVVVIGDIESVIQATEDGETSCSVDFTITYTARV